VLRYLQTNYSDINKISENDRNDIAASFQHAAVKALVQNVNKALKQFDFSSISLVGGVAANNKLRNELFDIGRKYQKNVVIPGMEFCGDNAAMIALRGKFLYDSGVRHNLDFKPYPSLGPNYFAAL
jgi:N6-L-threonylcarbamoyladenine synthase